MGGGTSGTLGRLHLMLARTSAWWLVDRPASSRPAMIRSIAAQVLATVAAIVAVRWVALPVLQARPPADLPGDGTNGVRFGLSEVVRHEIFRDLAASEPASRARAAQAFPGDPWSTEDHRASFERDLVRSIAQRRDLSLTQVYLILDEGIRDHWPGPDGRPLSSASYPLSPRKR